MDDVRYNPPKAALLDAEHDIVAPDEVLDKIRHAWVACLVSAAFTLMWTLVSMTVADAGPFGAGQLIDVALILGLAYGIYRRSRVCAVLMVLYFVAAKIWLVRTTGHVGGLLFGLVFLYFYAQGVVGTFADHKLRKQG